MFDETYIRNIAEEALNEKVTAVRTIYAGGMNFVFELMSFNRAIMFKAYPKARKGIARAEFDILTAARRAGADVPEVIAYGMRSDLGYLIYPALKGIDLNFDVLKSTEQALFSKDLIHQLRLLSSISFERFGNITEEENMFDDWSSFLYQNIEAGRIALADGKHISQELLHKIVKFMLNHPLLSRPCQARLTWGDLKSENILVSTNRLAALLDFESCFSGDPLLSLGYLFAREGESVFYQRLSAQFQGFIPFNDEDVYFYALFRLMRISKYLNAPLPTGKHRQPVLTYFPGIQKTLNLIDFK